MISKVGSPLSSPLSCSEKPQILPLALAHVAKNTSKGTGGYGKKYVYICIPTSEKRWLLPWPRTNLHEVANQKSCKIRMTGGRQQMAQFPHLGLVIPFTSANNGICAIYFHPDVVALLSRTLRWGCTDWKRTFSWMVVEGKSERRCAPLVPIFRCWKQNRPFDTPAPRRLSRKPRQIAQF